MLCKSHLKNFIESTTDLNEIIPVLLLLRLEDIKNFVIQMLKNFDATEQNKMYFEKLPITYILSDDLIQYILSFNRFDETRFINKKFKLLTDKNERIYYQRLYDSMNLRKSITYIVNEKRNSLYSIEKKADYKGPYRDVENIINVCNDNAQIIIHPGDYVLSDENWIDKNIEIIGITDRDTGINPVIGYCATLNIGGDNVVLENITLYNWMNSNPWASIYIESGNCKVKNCVFRCLSSEGDSYINVQKDVNFEAYDCEFHQGKEAVGIHPMAGCVEIHNCYFGDMTATEDWPGCVVIYGENTDIEQYGSYAMINCTKNTFSNNGDNFPFVEQCTNDTPYNECAESQCNLKDNWICGIYSKNKKDPNKLYCVDFD